MDGIISYALSKKLVGKALLGISDIKLNDDETMFVVTADDGTVFTVAVPQATNTKVTSEIKSSVDCGAINTGKVIPVGTTLQSALEMLLVKEESPSVVLTLSVSDGQSYTTVREKGTPVDVTINALVTKKSYDINNVEWVKGVVATEIASADTNTYTRTLNNIEDTTTITCKATDINGLVGSATKTMKFVNPVYNPIITGDVEIDTITEADILNGSKLLYEKGEFTSVINANAQKVVWSFPAEYGELKSIKDVKNNLELLSGYNKTTIDVTMIDGTVVPYYVYVPVLESTITDFTFKLTW